MDIAALSETEQNSGYTFFWKGKAKTDREDRINPRPTQRAQRKANEAMPTTQLQALCDDHKSIRIHPNELRGDNRADLR